MNKGDKNWNDVSCSRQNVVISARRPKVWRKRQDLNLHELKLDDLANRYGYLFITFPKKLERVIGFEPMICGFADRRLNPLGYTRFLKTEGEGIKAKKNFPYL